MKRLAWIVLLSFACGCGKGTGDVKGSVTYKNVPLKTGTVTVRDSDGKVQQVNVDDNGNYEFKGVATGKAKFTVYAMNPAVIEAAKDLAGGAREGGGARVGKNFDLEKIQGNLIPDKYSDENLELLTFDIQRGPNTFDLKLTP